MLKHGRNQAEQVTKGVGLDLGGSYNRGTPVFGDRRVQVEKVRLLPSRLDPHRTDETWGLQNLVALPNVQEIITLPTSYFIFLSGCQILGQHTRALESPLYHAEIIACTK